MTKEEKDRLEAFATDILKTWMDEIRRAETMYPGDKCEQSWVRAETRAAYALVMERMVKRGLIVDYSVVTGKVTMRRRKPNEQ